MNARNAVLLQLGGTTEPESAQKDVADQLFGGCFGVILLFFFLTTGFIFSIIAVLHYII